VISTLKPQDAKGLGWVAFELVVQEQHRPRVTLVSTNQIDLSNSPAFAEQNLNIRQRLQIGENQVNTIWSGGIAGPASDVLPPLFAEKVVACEEDIPPLFAGPAPHGREKATSVFLIQSDTGSPNPRTFKALLAVFAMRPCQNLIYKSGDQDIMDTFHGVAPFYGKGPSSSGCFTCA
jgi:hypothetical protein